jgi:aspartate/methionine/tyrosine aminotransferase
MTRTSEKAVRFTESVIRETFRLAAQHGAINLGQGYPDFPCPQELKDAACAAILADDNQYPMTFGTRPFRAAIAEKTARTYPGWEVDPDTELCVTCGATEALVAVAFALLDPGDEVVMFEPWYENYQPDGYYADLADRYLKRRDLLCDALERIGFGLRRPDGSYYVLCDMSPLDAGGDGVAFARRLITEIGVSCVPAVSFWQPENAVAGRSMIRFAFPKRPETLHAAVERLERLKV